jgi:hypothetical protein
MTFLRSTPIINPQRARTRDLQRQLNKPLVETLHWRSICQLPTPISLSRVPTAWIAYLFHLPSQDFIAFLVTLSREFPNSEKKNSGIIRVNY